MLRRLLRRIPRPSPRALALSLALGASLALSVPTLGLAQSGRTAATIERTIEVDGDTIRLGRRLFGAERWVTVKGDTLVRIPPTYFDADADGLLVVRDGSSGPVIRFALLYAATRNADALVGAHMRDYGRTPQYASNPVPEGVQESWTWSDGKTALTLTRFTPAQNGIAALRIVTDLAAPRVMPVPPARPSGEPPPF
jgi:hypothetical protein